MTPTQHLGRALQAIGSGLASLPTVGPVEVGGHINETSQNCYAFVVLQKNRDRDHDEELRRREVDSLAALLLIGPPREVDPHDGTALYTAIGNVGHESCRVSVSTTVMLEIRAAS